MRKYGRLNWFKQIFLLVLLVLLAAPQLAHAQEPSKQTVRIGLFESSIYNVDESGRVSGYIYEYQQEVAAYSGWTYEYVKGSWSDLLQMLIDGKIDILSDVSYTEERSGKMLFSELPMGEEEYFIFVSPGNKEIKKDDHSTINGKRIGVNRDSIQAGLLREWLKKNGIEAEIVELSNSEKDKIGMMDRGELDLYVALDFYGGDTTHLSPLCKIGSSDFYFAVNKDRPDLLAQLNKGMGRIRDANRYYNQQMYFKYFTASGINLFLNDEELDWLSEHGTIRVGYQDNYLAFCAKDPNTGKLTGALKDYLETASSCLQNAKLEFETVAYPSLETALAALESGRIDCLFPINFSAFDAEKMGVFKTQPITNTDVSAIVKSSDRKSFGTEDNIRVAAITGDANYELLLRDHFPNWEKVYFQDVKDCLQAVSKGQADCFLVSSFRLNNLAILCQQLDLVSLSSGEEMDFSFAVDRENTILYSLLSKVISMIPRSSINSALSYHFTEESRLSFREFMNQNSGMIVVVIGAVLFVIFVLAFSGFLAHKKAIEEKKLISATENDDLTGLYNKSYFMEYVNRINKESRGKPMDAVVLDIEQFHSINSINGRSFGDQVLKAVGEEISAYLAGERGIASRLEGDRFSVYCNPIEDPHVLFDRVQKRLDGMSPYVNIRLRMGVKPWQEGEDPSSAFDQAHVACSMARSNYQDHLVVFSEAVKNREAFEQKLLNDLRHSVDNREFEVYYQPKYAIQVESPELRSAEALVRWKHPEFGMISPNDFIPLFEKNGQIGILDKFVWAEAARQIAEWRDEYGVVLPVSVNLSRVDVFDPALDETLDMLLEKYNLEHSAFKLEVTESAYTENYDQVIPVVERLRSKGYEIEMDDFGSGYSSLNMLSIMPIDVLKMDRIFILNMEHEEKAIQMVELVLGIAKNLKVPVVAEGVETESQLDLLRKLGCDYVQGFYFSRPLPPEEFKEKILNKAFN